MWKRDAAAVTKELSFIIWFLFQYKIKNIFNSLIRKLSSRFGTTLECESAFSTVHFGNQNVGLIIMYVLILLLMTILCLYLKYTAWKIYIGTWWVSGKIFNHVCIMCLSDLDYLAKWNILLKFIIFFLLFKWGYQKKHKIMHIIVMFLFSGPQHITCVIIKLYQGVLAQSKLNVFFAWGAYQSIN